MAKRSKLRKTAKKAKESLAGTVSDASASLKQKVRNAKARRELANYRSDEVTDQGQARIERAKAEARQEAMQEARQEFQKEYREEVKDNVRDEQLEALRRQYGLSDDESGSGGMLGGGISGPDPGGYDPEERLGEMFGADAGMAGDDERAADILSGFGFGEETGTTLVGVDQNNDGKFSRDEFTVFPQDAAAEPPKDEPAPQPQRFDPVGANIDALFGDGPRF